MTKASIRLAHVAMAVTDLEASTRFYRDGLGFEVGPRFDAGDDVAAIAEVAPPVQMTSQYLTMDGVRLELMGWAVPGVEGEPSRFRNQRGLTHLAFEVDDLVAAEARLLAAGATPIAGARAQLERDPAPISFVVLADPDGTRIELIQRHES